MGLAFLIWRARCGKMPSEGKFVVKHKESVTPNVYSSPQSSVSEEGSISVAHGTEVRVLGLEIRILFCEEEERCNYSTVLVQWITIQQKVLISQQQTEFDS
jgi:hypothetical protein